MRRQRYTRPPLDELRLGLRSTEGQQPLRIAGDGALVRLPDGTLGVVATFGQATNKLHVLTEQGTMKVDGDQLVQILAHPVLAAKLLIQLAQTVSALDQMDGLSCCNDWRVLLGGPRPTYLLDDPGVMEAWAAVLHLPMRSVSHNL